MDRVMAVILIVGALGLAADSRAASLQRALSAATRSLASGA